MLFCLLFNGKKNAQEQMYVLSEMEAHAGPW